MYFKYSSFSSFVVYAHAFNFSSNFLGVENEIFIESFLKNYFFHLPWFYTFTPFVLFSWSWEWNIYWEFLKEWIFSSSVVLYIHTFRLILLGLRVKLFDESFFRKKSLWIDWENNIELTVESWCQYEPWILLVILFQRRIDLIIL